MEQLNRNVRAALKRIKEMQKKKAEEARKTRSDGPEEPDTSPPPSVRDGGRG